MYSLSDFIKIKCISTNNPLCHITQTMSKPSKTINPNGSETSFLIVKLTWYVCAFEFYMTVIRPVLLYGAECWTVRKKEEQILEKTGDVENN